VDTGRSGVSAGLPYQAHAEAERGFGTELDCDVEGTIHVDWNGWQSLVASHGFLGGVIGSQGIPAMERST